MSKRGAVTRRAIVSALASSLRRLAYVHAFWEGGAVAFGRADEWSDLDLYVLVDDGTSTAAFKAMERTLRSLSPISLVYVVQSGYEGVAQKFYKLERASEYAVVDLAIVTFGSREKFLTPEVHGENVFYFNKRNAVKAAPLDRRSLERRVEERVRRLEARFTMFNNHVLKELKRGNSLEALENYRSITLATLVELLRIKHNPVHFDFRMRYVHNELPRIITRRLEKLSYVRDSTDLLQKYRESTSWCFQLLEVLRSPRGRSLDSS
jgi:hypothetical protein